MECLTDIKIQEYVEDELNSVESAIVRDHLIVCEACKVKHDHYQRLENLLSRPLEITPPAIIERNVMNRLFPVLPSYSSIITLIAASFVLLITGIYIYFDFANNSIVRALQITSNNTSNWIASIITFISTIFSGVYAFFKVMNRFLAIVFQINLGAEIIGLSVLLMVSLLFYPLFRAALKGIKN